MVLGTFRLGDRLIEVSTRGMSQRLWLKRLEPIVEMELGYIDRPYSDAPRLVLYRAEWSTDLRRAAITEAVALAGTA